MTQLRVFRAGQPEFEIQLRDLALRGEQDLGAVEGTVRAILASVRREGDPALASYVKQFEQRDAHPLFERDYGGKAALEQVSPEVREALKLAHQRIRGYHLRQAEKLGSFEYTEDGVFLASRVNPLASVGVYAPGGKATYPSSVLMTAVVAQVAGVPEIILACPSPSAEVRAAAYLSGVTGLLNAGGAQAVAALAYGTQTVPRVAKIVGPGNLYVTCAKRLVFGDVAIDGLAGPSEILVVADETADPKVVAADLLSQAEHDEAAYPLLVCSDAGLLEQIQSELALALEALPRRDIAQASVAAHGVAFLVSNRTELARVADLLAVEHVSLQCADARALAVQVRHAGAIFMGHATPEAAGDYVAGPSHVLPTGGAARFGAPLGVYDFVSRTSLIEYSPAALAAHAPAITALATAEGLEAHGRAVQVRLR
ncbi:MAG: histidinol dehydrogenase [Polyangiaceae bacterium]|nr:histidinol dehydrogenase [Polyangiaceae bacterium]